jgi:hypothetical protein
MNYQECAELIAGKRGGYKGRYKLKHETWVVQEQVKDSEGEVRDEYVVRLFDKPIMRYFPDGVIQLDSCGYRTVTTKQRFNQYLEDWSVYQERSIWYVVKHTPGVTYGKAPRFAFQDGMRLYPLGFVEGAGPDPDELRALDKKIVKYAHAYVEALFDGKVPAPSQGDCWFCALRTDRNGKTLGEATGDTEHLLSHMEEPYYVPSMLDNAMGEFPGNVSRAARWAVGRLWYPQHGNPVGFQDIAKEQLRSVLRKYLRRKLGLAS